MTTLIRSSSKVLLALGFVLTAQAQANICTREFPVLERNPKGDKFRFVSKPLVDLSCTNAFEGRYFKIVHSTDDHAIPFDHADPALVKKAANVYHHLTVARNYWVNEIKSDYVQSLPQIVIRLDITNAFSSVRHFKHAEQEKNYNNAWSVPEGETPSIASAPKKWGKEIWFSPMKKIDSKKSVKSDGSNPVHQSLLLVQDPLTEYNKNSAIYSGMALLVTPSINQSKLLDNSLKSLGAIAVLYGAIEVTKHADKWFMSKYFFIDTALVPEIIYHEYAHIAMSDTMKTVHSVPVIEGMADYFASAIAQRKRMYDGLDEISNNQGKNLKSKMMYHPYIEGEWNATSDFTVSVLWQGRLAFDKQNEERAKKNQPALANYDDLVFRAHKGLTETSTIADHLTRALIVACRDACSNQRVGIGVLNTLFEKRGFN